MKKEKMIEEIYEKVASKELSFGCRIRIGEKNSVIYSKYDALLDRSPTTPYKEKSIWNIQHSIGNNYQLCVFDRQKVGELEYNILNDKEKFKIIGHPVMIGDVLDYNDGLDRDYIPFGMDEVETNLIVLWNNGKREPIEEQSKETIEYVYNLIKKYAN